MDSGNFIYIKYDQIILMTMSESSRNSLSRVLFRMTLCWSTCLGSRMGSDGSRSGGPDGNHRFPLPPGLQPLQ